MIEIKYLILNITNSYNTYLILITLKQNSKGYHCKTNFFHHIEIICFFFHIRVNIFSTELLINFMKVINETSYIN